MGDLSEEAHGPRDDIVEVGTVLEERFDGAAFGGAHRLERGKTVDEHPVALVRGNATGAGVRLVDESGLFEEGHVIADRRR